jgi:hypothetical protein
VEYFKTPILLITFNRPETTLKVLEAIKKYKPKFLYISNDGPRPDNIKDQHGIREVRKLINEFIDWDCEVKKLYREENLGCKFGVINSINWFFENVEEGIVLEDDCLPAPSFFPYCEQLLEKYRHHNEIMMISGDYFSLNACSNDDSYYFTKHFHIWGWASWRRAWKKYEVEMKDWPNLANDLKNELKFENRVWKSYRKALNKAFHKKIDAWDYQWLFTGWKNNGLAICPTTNLISNIGFGAGATHTFNTESILSKMPTGEMKFPLIHPEKIERNFEIEKKCEEISFPRLSKKIKDRLMMYFKKLFLILFYSKPARSILPFYYLTKHQKSYSQEGEDMVLQRMFENQKTGFYVDIGAHHPVRFSNTYHFYKRGWRGINIDAMPGSMSLFNIFRRRDINLEIPISNESKVLDYYIFNEPALNGFSKELSEKRDGDKGTFKILNVVKLRTSTLREILMQHMPAHQEIDFMSVDVEGLDLEVLKSNDWKSYRPRYLLIEIYDLDLNRIEDNSIYKFLKSYNYELVSKCVYTCIFKAN